MVARISLTGSSSTNRRVNELLDKKRVCYTVSAINALMLLLPAWALIILCRRSLIVEMALHNNHCGLLCFPCVVGVCYMIVLYSARHIENLSPSHGRRLFTLLILLLCLHTLNVRDSSIYGRGGGRFMGARAIASLMILDWRYALPMNLLFSSIVLYKCSTVEMYGMDGPGVRAWSCIAESGLLALIIGVGSALEQQALEEAEAIVESGSNRTLREAVLKILGVTCDAHVQLDAEHRVLDHSPALPAMLSNPSSDMTKDSFAEYIAMEDRLRYLQLMADPSPANAPSRLGDGSHPGLQATAPASMNMTMRTRTGEPVHAQLISVHFLDSNDQAGHLLGIRDLGRAGQHDAGRPDAFDAPGAPIVSDSLGMPMGTLGPRDPAGAPRLGPSERQVDVDAMTQSSNDSESLHSAGRTGAPREWDLGGVSSARLKFDVTTEGMTVQEISFQLEGKRAKGMASFLSREDFDMLNDASRDHLQKCYEAFLDGAGGEIETELGDLELRCRGLPAPFLSAAGATLQPMDASQFRNLPNGTADDDDDGGGGDDDGDDDEEGGRGGGGREQGGGDSCSERSEPGMDMASVQLHLSGLDGLKWLPWARQARHRRRARSEGSCGHRALQTLSEFDLKAGEFPTEQDHVAEAFGDAFSSGEGRSGDRDLDEKSGVVDLKSIGETPLPVLLGDRSARKIKADT